MLSGLIRFCFFFFSFFLPFGGGTGGLGVMGGGVRCVCAGCGRCVGCGGAVIWGRGAFLLLLLLTTIPCAPFRCSFFFFWFVVYVKNLKGDDGSGVC